MRQLVFSLFFICATQCYQPKLEVALFIENLRIEMDNHLRPDVTGILGLGSEKDLSPKFMTEFKINSCGCKLEEGTFSFAKIVQVTAVHHLEL